ncbi:MAG: hypothetical protein JWM98_1944, partial [Thermoleophilia bacterium]|nr:hypothetical protein [Thermoleophilia bacterium]
AARAVATAAPTGSSGGGSTWHPPSRAPAHHEAVQVASSVPAHAPARHPVIQVATSSP